MSSSASPTTPLSTDGFPSQTPTDSSSATTSTSAAGGLAASSSLYLFTFLATLLLLLAVSAAIVFRSLIVRRRFQRRVQEALAQGIVLPPGPGQRRRDFGEKPVLWDAWIAPDEGDARWEDIMPVSAKILSDKLTGAGQRPASATPRSTFLQSASSGLARAQRWWPPLFRTPRLDTNANANANAAPALEEPVIEDARLLVSVLIAMPSQYRPRAWVAREHARGADGHGMKGKARSERSYDDDSHTDAEGDVPDVVFGVADVPWKVLVEKAGEHPVREH